jgi:putative ubiquitin-RnfH superfamily antitoxin RatB of RatAB toxin-antitoxin module
MIKIELVYVTADKQAVHLSLELPTGSLVSDALMAAKIHETHPETTACAVGIYAKVVPLDTVLRDGDRIELYRPLAVDPKEKRRRLARRKK